jgi:hypothetical protein
MVSASVDVWYTLLMVGPWSIALVCELFWLVRGTYHNPLDAFLVPLVTSFPLCLTTHSFLLKMTSQPAWHSFVTEMRE